MRALAVVLLVGCGGSPSAVGVWTGRVTWVQACDGNTGGHGQVDQTWTIVSTMVGVAATDTTDPCTPLDGVASGDAIEFARRACPPGVFASSEFSGSFVITSDGSARAFFVRDQYRADSTHCRMVSAGPFARK